MNSNRKAAPNGQAEAIIKEFSLEVLLNNNIRIMKNEITALTQVTGKIIFKSVVGPPRSCFRTVGPIQDPGPVEFKISHCIHNGKYIIHGFVRNK
jgi:hypothetical protein